MDEKRGVFYEFTLWTPQKHVLEVNISHKRLKMLMINVNGLRLRSPLRLR